MNYSKILTDRALHHVQYISMLAARQHIQASPRLSNLLCQTFPLPWHKQLVRNFKHTSESKLHNSEETMFDMFYTETAIHHKHTSTQSKIANNTNSLKSTKPFARTSIGFRGLLRMSCVKASRGCIFPWLVSHQDLVASHTKGLQPE